MHVAGAVQKINILLIDLMFTYSLLNKAVAEVGPSGYSAEIRERILKYLEKLQQVRLLRS